MTPKKIAVIGGGAWGIALANIAAQTRDCVTIWMRRQEEVDALIRDGESRSYLPGLPLQKNILPTADMLRLTSADIVFLVVPAQALRAVIRSFKNIVAQNITIIICSKGLERGTKKFMSDVVSEEMPDATISILSGPSFAQDVCMGLPTAVTLAAHDEHIAEYLCHEISIKNFRLYRSTDVRGVEIGGAAKNVFAIAAGMAFGRLLGPSAQSALIARSFAELNRLGRALGVRQETLMGLSGLGDLVLTCSSVQSRNFSLGQALGQGIELGQATKGKLVEGAYTAEVLVELANQNNIEMPIVSAVDAILRSEITVNEAIDSLLMRPLRAEI